MAAIIEYGDGLRRIEYTRTANGPRQRIILGRVTLKAAETFRARIESIVSDLALGRPHSADVCEWLRGLDERYLAKLRKHGLAAGVGTTETTLGEFLKRYFESIAVKESTRTFYEHTRRNLETHFGKSRAVRSIKPADADEFRVYLADNQKLARATVARRIIAARTIWRMAIRWNLASENVFDGVKGGHQQNESRKQFVTKADIERAIDATPDLEWKVIIALARYGGLRTPSETFAMKWTDIDFDRGTIRVRSPKTEHHTGKGERLIPLFPELRDRLLRLFTEAADGAEFVITRNRLDGMNLRTQFVRIINRAGMTEWPKLFHNLRASRETELMREYDLATVCRWIGNSPAVAATHYATSMDLAGDFKRANSAAVKDAGDAKAHQKAHHSGEGDGSDGANRDASTPNRDGTKPGADDRDTAEVGNKKAHQKAHHPAVDNADGSGQRGTDDRDGLSKTPRITACVPDCPPASLAVLENLWALQDSNTVDIAREIPLPENEGASKSASFGPGTDSEPAGGSAPAAAPDTDPGAARRFAAGLALIASLPLSDAERAEAVRRLLAAGG